MTPMYTLCMVNRDWLALIDPCEHEAYSVNLPYYITLSRNSELYSYKRSVLYLSRPLDTLYVGIQNNNNNKKSQEFVYLCFHLTLCKYVFTICICMLFIHTHTHTYTWGLCVCLSDVVRLVCIYSKACRDAVLVVVSFFLLGMGGKSVARIYTYICRAKRQSYDP